MIPTTPGPDAPKWEAVARLRRYAEATNGDQIPRRYREVNTGEFSPWGKVKDDVALLMAFFTEHEVGEKVATYVRGETT